jgi:hypothetical protein
MIMDREATTKQMRDLKQKAKQARCDGKRDAAAGFRAGADRLQRRLERTAPKARRQRGKKD